MVASGERGRYHAGRRPRRMRTIRTARPTSGEGGRPEPSRSDQVCTTSTARSLSGGSLALWGAGLRRRVAGFGRSLRAPNLSAWCFCNAWIETWHYYSTAFRLYRVHAVGRRNHRRTRLGRTPSLASWLLTSFNPRLNRSEAPLFPLRKISGSSSPFCHLVGDPDEPPCADQGGWNGDQYAHHRAHASLVVAPPFLSVPEYL